jgi:hypothetical protein
MRERRNRNQTCRSLDAAVVAATEYMATHPRANAGTQLKNLRSLPRRTTFNLEGRSIAIGKDTEAQAEASKLHGCYLSQTAASKHIVHDRYKDLALVE